MESATKIRPYPAIHEEDDRLQLLTTPVPENRENADDILKRAAYYSVIDIKKLCSALQMVVLPRLPDGSFKSDRVEMEISNTR